MQKRPAVSVTAVSGGEAKVIRAPSSGPPFSDSTTPQMSGHRASLALSAAGGDVAAVATESRVRTPTGTIVTGSDAVTGT